MIKVWFFCSWYQDPPWFHLFFHPWVTTETTFVKCSEFTHLTYHSTNYTGITQCVYLLIIMQEGEESFREFTEIFKEGDIIIYVE